MYRNKLSINREFCKKNLKNYIQLKWKEQYVCKQLKISGKKKSIKYTRKTVIRMINTPRSRYITENGLRLGRF